MNVIDRIARDELIDLINSYLSEQITAFSLDERLEPFRDSEDSAVRFVSRAMWYHYDDCDDHLVVVSKPEWNFLQRLLLLLASNSTVIEQRHRQWSWTQPIAAILLFGCLYVTYLAGLGWHLLVFFVPFGLASIVLSRFRFPRIERHPYDMIVSPFATVQDLHIAYNGAIGFSKRQCPEQIASRLIRSPSVSRFYFVQSLVIWAIYAPLPLLVQCFPIRHDSTQVCPG